SRLAHPDIGQSDQHAGGIGKRTGARPIQGVKIAEDAKRRLSAAGGRALDRGAWGRREPGQRLVERRALDLERAVADGREQRIAGGKTIEFSKGGEDIGRRYSAAIRGPFTVVRIG